MEALLGQQFFLPGSSALNLFRPTPKLVGLMLNILYRRKTRLLSPAKSLEVCLRLVLLRRFVLT